MFGLGVRVKGDSCQIRLFYRFLTVKNKKPDVQALGRREIEGLKKYYYYNKERKNNVRGIFLQACDGCDGEVTCCTK
jgi:hypothetical protein